MRATLGIDIGSSLVKIALRQADGSFWQHKLATVDFYKKISLYKQDNWKKFFTEINVPYELTNLNILATGYGRNTVALPEVKIIPEIQAHIKGVILQTAVKNFVLLDIGGQDTKAALVKEGKLVDFVTNDRCAASSGRYLENMAKTLGLTITELGKYSQNPVTLNSTCAVFTESELIGKLAEGVTVPELAAGVNNALVRRILPMLQKFPKSSIWLSGGGALNPAIKQLLSNKLKVSVKNVPDPIFNAARGCCGSKGSV